VPRRRFNVELCTTDINIIVTPVISGVPGNFWKVELSYRPRRTRLKLAGCTRDINMIIKQEFWVVSGSQGTDPRIFRRWWTPWYKILMSITDKRDHLTTKNRCWRTDTLAQHCSSTFLIALIANRDVLLILECTRKLIFENEKQGGMVEGYDNILLQPLCVYRALQNQFNIMVYNTAGDLWRPPKWLPSWVLSWKLLSLQGIIWLLLVAFKKLFHTKVKNAHFNS